MNYSFKNDWLMDNWSLRMNNQWITGLRMNNQWMTGLGMNGPNERIYKKRRRSTAQQELKHIQLQDLNRTRKHKKPANNHRLYLAGWRVSHSPPLHSILKYVFSTIWNMKILEEANMRFWNDKIKIFCFVFTLLKILSNWSCQLNPFLSSVDFIKIL